MKDTKRKAHELAAIVERVAGILFDTPEPERKRRSDFYPGADEDGMVGPEPVSVRKTAFWKWEHIVRGQDMPRLWFCSECKGRTLTNTSDGDAKDINPIINGWNFCPYCGADMRDDER